MGAPENKRPTGLLLGNKMAKSVFCFLCVIQLYVIKMYCALESGSLLGMNFFLQPESEADSGSVGEGTSGASGAMKRGMSVDSAQDVKRFRTAAGTVGTVRKP